MEQRNGRIDRHGQKADEVLIWHPVDSDTSKGAIGGHAEDILRALRKIDSMRQDLGSVNALIEPQISQVLEGSKKELETAVAERKMVSAKKYMRTDSRLKERITKLHERLVETQDDYHLTPAHIQATVETALSIADKPKLIIRELTNTPNGTVFDMPALAGNWARCMEGLEHPHTRKIRPITFDHTVAKGRDDVVLVHMNHRLVQMALRLLRAEVWAQDDVKKLHRVTVKCLPDDQLESPALLVLSRLVITGGKHHRLHEELIESGGYLADSFKREPRVTEVRRWLEDSTACSIDDSTFTALKTRFERFISAIQSSISSRARDRLTALEKTLQLQQEKEIKDITDVLSELEKTIQNELMIEKQPEQLGFVFEDLSETERTQLKRDTQALEARLARIPEERENETQAINLRFAEPTEHTFPIAIVLLVPQSLASPSQQES